MRITFVTLACCLFLSACGGRASHPVNTTNDYDSTLTCDHLRAELAVNNRHIDDLRKEKDQAENNNWSAVLLTGVMSLDVSDTEEKEIKALQDRNAVLNNLIATKCTPAAGNPVSQTP